MNEVLLEISQMLSKHPIMNEKTSYKIQYINVLEYFVRKYSNKDIWSNAVLRLYIKKLLDREADYQYQNIDLKRNGKKVLAIKFRPFKFYSYRYCFVFDCIFMNAYCDKNKGDKIFSELSAIYYRVSDNLRRVFEFLYNSDISIDDINIVQYMKDCWNKNRTFLLRKPIQVIVTANMSAGKSTLLNALVGKKVTKTQNDACTAKIHHIVSKAFEDGFCYELDYLLELDADYHTLMEDNEQNKSDKITVGTYFLTIGNAPKRLHLIDTPGVNSSQNKEHKQLSENTIKSSNADLLIYLLNGENIGTDDDRRHLIFILENYSGPILFVINKLDRFRQKEDCVAETIEAVRADLNEIGFVQPRVVPISSYAAYLAKKKIFGAQLDEDEQDEFDRLSRKLKKEEYQFNTYYADDIQKSVHLVHADAHDENYQLLLHSGILQLEAIIYNIGG